MRRAKLRIAAATGVFDTPLKSELDLDDLEGAQPGAAGNEERARRTGRALTAALKAYEPYHSGRKAWINIPIRSPDGGLVGILHAVGQRHARKTAAPMRYAPWDREIFKAAAEQAELVVSLLSAEERRSALLAYVTHEIRAPVNTVRATLDVLQHRPHDDAQFQQKLAAIKLEAEILLDLAHKLDGFFGPPRAVSRDSDAVDVEPLLATVIGQMEPDMKERGFARSDVDVSLRSFPRVRMPLADLKQIFFNLFRNALLYADAASSPKFRVRVVSNMNSQRPVLYFRDWGVGIVEGDRERIFEAGVRGSNAQEVQVRGTGLGLAICRQLLGEHGATIAVTNLHKPTEFTIEFPYHTVEQS
jgi:signal transduction histidine kinase